MTKRYVLYLNRWDIAKYSIGLVTYESSKYEHRDPTNNTITGNTAIAFIWKHILVLFVIPTYPTVPEL